MIQTIIDALDLAASAQLPTATRSGLAELKPSGQGTAPFLYAGGSDWTQIATDASGTYSYWRLTSPVVEVDTDGPSCNDYFQATYQLRLVSFVDREMCGALPDAARSAASAIRGADVDVAAALALSPRSGVTRVQVDLDSAKIFQQEFGTSGDVPPGKSLVAIDVTLAAIGKASCFAPCQEPESLLCMTIGIATWNAIKACMSQAQIDDAEADLCNGGGPCPPTTVNGTESDTPTITVLQGGVEVGTLNPATGVHTVPECDPCDPLTVTLAGVEIVNEADPCGVDVALACMDTVDAVWVAVAVEAQKVGLYTSSAQVNGRTSYENAPNHVIEWTGTQYQLRDIFTGPDWVTTNAPATPWAGTWVNVSDGTPIDGSVAQGTIGDICRTPCDPLDYEVYNTEGTLIIDGSQVDPCGALVQLTAQDGAAVLKDTAGTTISTTPIPATSTKNITAPNAAVQLKDSAANNIGSINNYLSGSTNNLTAPDGSVQLQDSAGANIGSTVPVRSNQTGVVVTAPDGTVTVEDHLGNTLGSTTVKSNGTATVVVSDWEGEFPVLTENTPTFNDEGTSTAGWTITGGSMAITSGVNRLTQASTAAAAQASQAVTMPTTNGDWVVYAKIKTRRTTGDAQVLVIDGPGLERAFIYFNFNSTTSSSQLGTISIRGTNAAGTNSNAVYATGVFMDTNWQEVCLLYNHARLSFSIYIRQTDGSWLFGAQVNGTFFGTQIRLTANNTTTVGAWIEFDYLTLVAPNIQSIGDSLTQGATLFSPVVASALTNGASTWQRWAPLYPALRNNLIVNKGVGSNTTALVAARIAADCINMGAKLVLLSACNNDIGVGITQAQRTANTQSSIDLCAASSIPVVLYNATYDTAAFAGQPAALNYYREWWTDYRPTLTGLAGSIDIMGSQKDPNGYADVLFTQSDNVHPNVTGYTRMGQWIAALPYA